MSTLRPLINHGPAEEIQLLQHSATNAPSNPGLESSLSEAHPFLRDGSSKDHLMTKLPIVTSQEISTTRIIERPMFTPRWLQKKMLYTFAGLFVLSGLAVGMLYYFSNVYNGFSISFSSNHYLWNYAPTAVLVIVVSLWRQVEYWCKALAPWQSLQTNSATAEQTVLLNYVQPVQAVALWKASGYKHWGVVGTVSASLLLKVLIILSTGLLDVEPTRMSKASVPLILTRDINQTSPDMDNFEAVSNFLTDLRLGIDDSAVFLYNSIISNGLAFPKGTSATEASQTFQVVDQGGLNATTKARVLAIRPELTCEVGQVDYTAPDLVNPTIDLTYLYFNVTSQNCTIDRALITLVDPRYYEVPPRHVIGEINLRACTGQESSADAPWLFTMTDVRYTQTLVPNESTSSDPSDATNDVYTNASIAVKDFTAVLCWIGHTVLSTTLLYDTEHGLTNTGQSNKVDAPPRLLANPRFVNMWLWTAVDSALAASHVIFGEVQNAMPQLMGIENGNYTALLDKDALTRSATAVFQGLGAQVLAKYLFVPTSESLLGTTEYVETRLHVKTLSLGLMEGCYFVLLLLVLVTLVSRPHSVVPRDPTTIIGMATILRASKKFQYFCEGIGHYKQKALRDYFSGRSYWTQLDSSDRPAFELVSKPGEGSRRKSRIPPGEKKLRPWKPFILTMTGWILTLGLAAVVIGVLEFLQQFSDRHHGLFDTEFNTLKSRILASYLPASIMLLVAGLFSAVDFGLLTVAPFHPMKEGIRTDNSSLCTNYLSYWPPLALWKLLRQRNAAASFASLAAFAGAFLSIVVSGLYTPGTAPVQRDIDISRVDTFNLTWASSSTVDRGAANVFSAIEHSNFSSPAFTYGNLVFPKLQALDASANSNTSSAQQIEEKVVLQIPALRARLLCSIMDNVTLVNTVQDATRGSPGRPISQIDVQVPLPPTCSRGGRFGNESSITYAFRFPYPTAGGNYTSWVYANETFGGSMVDLHVGPWDKIYLTSYGEGLDNGYQPDNPEGCPSLGFAFGYFRRYTTPDLRNLTTFVCNQTIQQVLTNTTFLLPSLSIDPKNPPLVLEDTVRFLDNGTDNAIIRSYRPQILFEQRFQSFYNVTYNTYTATSSPLANIFQDVLWGPDGIPPEELVGVGNRERLMDAMNGVYSKFMAQAMSSNMRDPLSSSRQEIKDPDPERAIGKQDLRTSYSGTLTKPGRLRMVQNKTPKFILQGLLGFMVLCGLVAWVAGQSGAVVMHKPTDIAGLASLVAGSGLCADKYIPEEALWMSDEEVLNGGGLSELRVHMGWDGDGDGGGRRFGVYCADLREEGKQQTFS